jgi:hypothetical protein
MYNGIPYIIVILIKDAVQDEELLVDYGWTSGEGKKQATLCRCNSKQCRIFLEKDLFAHLKELLQKFKKIPSREIKVSQLSKLI